MNIGRSLLTMAGIIIGVASVITIISVGAGGQSLITGSIAKVGTRTITVLAGASDENGPPAAAQGILVTTLTYEDSLALEDIPYIEGVTAVYQSTSTLQHGRTTLDVSYEGRSPGFALVDGLTMRAGRFFTAEENRSAARVVVLGATIAEDLSPSGASPLGLLRERVTIGEEKYTVVGILQKKGSQVFGSPDETIYVPVLTAQKRLAGVDYIQAVRLSVTEDRYLSFVQQAVEQRLRYRHRIAAGEESDFSVRLVVNALNMVTGITSAVRVFLALVAGISLIVGGIGIMNIMLANVQRRTKEIGLRKALGAKAGSIRLQFLTETLVLTVLGGLIGTALGMALSYLVAVLARRQGYEWAFSIDPIAVAVGIGTAVVVGAVFGYSPAKKAAQMDAITALRYE